jgi:UTP--glucose-1-phosphate uridylyltransferase
LTRKAVIAAAGLGTRLLTVTKEQPKEMLPLFAATPSGMCLKPVLQLIFEQVYQVGLTEISLVVGRGKRSIEDHFTSDASYMANLNSRGKKSEARALQEFYRMLERTKIMWVNQPEPIGFGDAVLRAEPFVGSEVFLVHAGDTYVISPDQSHLRRMVRLQEELDADAVFLVQEVQDPKRHGIMVGSQVSPRVFEVTQVIEKPVDPPTNMGVMPIYVFKPEIMKALKSVSAGKTGEVELTDGIEKIIEEGRRVYAVKLTEDEMRLDVGTPESYWEALNLSHQHLATNPSAWSEASSCRRESRESYGLMREPRQLESSHRNDTIRRSSDAPS